jgi:hypothetical protein
MTGKGLCTYRRTDRHSDSENCPLKILNLDSKRTTERQDFISHYHPVYVLLYDSLVSMPNNFISRSTMFRTYASFNRTKFERFNFTPPVWNGFTVQSVWSLIFSLHLTTLFRKAYMVNSAYLQNVTTNNCDSLTKLHTLNITVTTAQIKCSQLICLHQSLRGNGSQ